MRSRCVVLMVMLLLGAARVVRAQQSDVCVSRIPANVQAGLLAQDLDALIQASPTFRAQCQRIAAAATLQVDLQVVYTLGVPRAETTIARYQAGAVRACVKIAFGQDYRELIAHEFEHVIEQLDRVDLRAEAEHGRAWLVETQVFETKRTSDVGRRVRRECERSGAHAAAETHHDLR